MTLKTPTENLFQNAFDIARKNPRSAAEKLNLFAQENDFTIVSGKSETFLKDIISGEYGYEDKKVFHYMQDGQLLGLRTEQTNGEFSAHMFDFKNNQKFSLINTHSRKMKNRPKQLPKVTSFKPTPASQRSFKLID